MGRVIKLLALAVAAWVGYRVVVRKDSFRKAFANTPVLGALLPLSKADIVLPPNSSLAKMTDAEKGRALGL